MFKAAKLSQDSSVTKSYFEFSIWIRLSIMHTASNNQGWEWVRGSSNFDVDTGLLSTAWT